MPKAWENLKLVSIGIRPEVKARIGKLADELSARGNNCGVSYGDVVRMLLDTAENALQGLAPDEVRVLAYREFYSPRKVNKISRRIKEAFEESEELSNRLSYLELLQAQPSTKRDTP